MAISKSQRNNLKVFSRAPDASFVCSDLKLNFRSLLSSLNTKDEDLFFSFYDLLVSRGIIRDKAHMANLNLASMSKTMTKVASQQDELLKPKSAPAPKPKTPQKASMKTEQSKALRSKAKKVRYNLLIDEDILEVLKQRAADMDRSVSSLIRISIVHHLNLKDKKHD